VNLPPVDTTQLLDFLTGLLNTPSPTGFAEAGVVFTEKALSVFPDISLQRTRKGALLAFWPGREEGEARALTAHVDTLGAVVKEIKPNGRLKLSAVGGVVWNSVEGEGCTVVTRSGGRRRGTILFYQTSVHVHGKELGDLKRDEHGMEVRLDERVSNPVETRAAGIEVGDFVTFDPRVETVNGFIRSRHLDDKACVACLLAAVRGMQEAGLRPRRNTWLLISNYEEVGHGAAAGIPPEVGELVAVDMAAVGEGQNSDEFHASLCVMDSGGPYHHGLSERLLDLARENGIAHKTDVYPHYGSDGEAFWRAGGDVAVALIGPGVDASHSYERTHLDALTATTQWIMAYLLS